MMMTMGNRIVTDNTYREKYWCQTHNTSTSEYVTPLRQIRLIFQKKCFLQFFSSRFSSNYFYAKSRTNPCTQTEKKWEKLNSNVNTHTHTESLQLVHLIWTHFFCIIWPKSPFLTNFKYPFWCVHNSFRFFCLFRFSSLLIHIFCLTG